MIDKYAQVTDFKQPANSFDRIALVTLAVIFTAKNGKKYGGFLCADAVTNKIEDQFSIVVRNHMRQKKIANAKKALRQLLSDKLTQRSGLRGYRGFFKFHTVQPWLDVNQRIY